jgi:hypothetical protein
MRNRLSRSIGLAAACLLSACGVGSIDAIGLAPGGGLSMGLVAHWTFDEGVDSVVHDSSGHAHDGTLNVNGPTWSWLAQGRFGGALHLEQGDYVSVDNFPNATPGWTVSTWVQIAAKDVNAGDATVISTEDVYRGGWEVNINAPTVSAPVAAYHFGFYTGPGNWIYAHYECSGCIHADQWQHLAAVVDTPASGAGTLSFYLDGVLQDRHQVPQAILPGVATLYMGRWATTPPPRLLVGSLDDIAIWSRPLVSEEVALLTQAPVP